MMSGPNRVSYGEIVPSSGQPRIFATVYDSDGRMISTDDPQMFARRQAPRPPVPEPPIVVKAKPVTNLPGMKKEAKGMIKEMTECKKRLKMKARFLTLLQYVVWGSALVLSVFVALEYRGDMIVYGAQRFHRVDCVNRASGAKRTARAVNGNVNVQYTDNLNVQQLKVIETQNEHCMKDCSCEVIDALFLNSTYYSPHDVPVSTDKNVSARVERNLFKRCPVNVSLTDSAVAVINIVNDSGARIYLGYRGLAFRYGVVNLTHLCYDEVRHDYDEALRRVSANGTSSSSLRRKRSTKWTYRFRREAEKNTTVDSTTSATPVKVTDSCPRLEFIPIEKSFFQDFVSKIGENCSVMTALEVLMSVALYVMRKNTRLELKNVSRKIKEKNLIASYSKRGESEDASLRKLLREALSEEDENE